MPMVYNSRTRRQQFVKAGQRLHPRKKKPSDSPPSEPPGPCCLDGMCISNPKEQCGFLTVFCAIYNLVEFFLPFTIVSLILWLLLRPSQLQPRVDAAVLTQFNLNNATSTLDYDMAIDINFHNRHSHFVVRYFDLTAVASYSGTRLGPSADVLDLFVQHPKATNVIHTIFQGSAVQLDPAAAKVVAREAANGSFNVLVTVASTVIYKIPILKPVYFYYHKCNIRFPATHGDMLSPGTLCRTTRR
ncbi:unnamed protein product [Alopecurus aequalis]